MRLYIFNSQEIVRFSNLEVRKLVKSYLAFTNAWTTELSLHFVDKTKICEVHSRYFDDPSPTDCITFPIDAPVCDRALLEPDHCLGEIFICPEVALEFALKENVPLSEEISLYILHGLLHLLGFDDIKKKEQLTMRVKEKEAICFAKKHELIPNFLFETKLTIPKS